MTEDATRGLHQQSQEIEQAATAVNQMTAAVEEVAVIGVDEPTWGQEVIAAVQLKSGDTLTEKAVIDFCKENLAAFKCPRYVRFVDQLPKTAIGKVRKHELIDQFGNVALRKK